MSVGDVFTFLSLLSSAFPSLLFFFLYGAVALNTDQNAIITYQSSNQVVNFDIAKRIQSRLFKTKFGNFSFLFSVLYI